MNWRARVIAGRIKELRDEGQKEGRRLGIERFDEHAIPKGPLRTDRSDLFRQQVTGLAKRPDAKPDQIDRAREFQCGEELGACKNDR